MKNVIILLVSLLIAFVTAMASNTGYGFTLVTFIITFMIIKYMLRDIWFERIK